jgi:hypothetical protein
MGTFEYTSSLWAALKRFSRSEWLMRTPKHVSRMWVALQCLSRSALLMTEHSSSEWVALQWLCRLEPHWQEWLNMHSASELLFICTDWNHLQKWLILYSECNLFLLPDVIPLTDFPWGWCFDSLFICLLQIWFKFWPVFNNLQFVEVISRHLYWSASCLFACMIFHLSYPILMPTALLICMENTFWNIRRECNFVELFKESFTLYVESGMRMKTEAGIDSILGNVQGDFLLTEHFKEQFFKLVIEHYLCKFYLFLLCLTHLTTFFT